MQGVDVSRAAVLFPLGARARALRLRRPGDHSGGRGLAEPARRADPRELLEHGARVEDGGDVPGAAAGGALCPRRRVVARRGERTAPPVRRRGRSVAPRDRHDGRGTQRRGPRLPRGRVRDRRRRLRRQMAQDRGQGQGHRATAAPPTRPAPRQVPRPVPRRRGEERRLAAVRREGFFFEGLLPTRPDSGFDRVIHPSIHP